MMEDSTMNLEAGITRAGQRPERDPPFEKSATSARTAGTTGEERIVFDPFVPEIHCAADGTLYQSVRSCDLELIRDK